MTIQRFNGIEKWAALSPQQQAAIRAAALEYAAGFFAATAAEDARLVALRRDGKRPGEIAEIVSAEFGTNRGGHGVRVRLIILASYTDGPEGA